jgi:ubiquinone/menaquinone biosynthesis C-methylase UbiE
MNSSVLIPDEGRVVARFDGQAPRYHGRYWERTSSGHSFRSRERRLYELFDKPGGTVLDIGCGPGVTVEHLVGQGCQFYGVDLSERMVAECQRVFGHLETAAFSVGRIERLAFPDEFFDAVICMGVVEYIADDAAAVREMARVVKPGGTVLVSLPNRWSPYRMWRRHVFRPAAEAARRLLGRGPRQGLFHREYRLGDYARLLAAHGLQAVEAVYYNVKVVPSPVDEWLPGFTVWTTERLERLVRSPLRGLATGLIVRAVKPRGRGGR